MEDLIYRQEAILHLQRTLDATDRNGLYNEGFCEGLEFAISFIAGLKSAEREKE